MSSFATKVLSCPTFSFDATGISEIYLCKSDARLWLTGYHNIISQHREDGPRGGVGLFIKNILIYKNRDDISVFIPHTFESVFIEITKAFDVINHDILLNKLHRYGIRRTVNEWFKSYLSNRLQFVEIDGNMSSSRPFILVSLKVRY